MLCSDGDESETSSKSRTKAMTFDIESVGSVVVCVTESLSELEELGNVGFEAGAEVGAKVDAEVCVGLEGVVEVVAVKVDDVVESSFLRLSN